MTGVASVNDSTGLLASSVINYIDSIKNTEIDSATLGFLKASIRSLVDLYNIKFFHVLPLEIKEVLIYDARFEISNSYHPDLTLPEMKRVVIENLTKAENLSDQSLFVDALCVLLNYCNVVILSRFNYALEIKQKNLDDSDSSKSSVHDQSSAHSLIGDDNHG